MLWALKSPHFFALVPFPRETLNAMFVELKAKPIAEISRVFSIIQSNQKSKRLGVYFEQVVLTAFTMFSGTDLMASGVQIQNGKTTVGEIDAVVFDKSSSEYWHIEIAVKFYMRIGVSANPEQWKGPNANDNLKLKFGKLKNHQLQLSDSMEVLKQLKTLGVPRVDKKFSLTRGAGFVPLVQGGECESPVEMATNATIGLWCYAHEAHKLLTIFSSDARWVLLPKLDWVGEVTFDDSRIMLNTKMAIEEVSNSQMKNALHFAVSRPKTQGDSKVIRVFVMPNNWPN